MFYNHYDHDIISLFKLFSLLILDKLSINFFLVYKYINYNKLIFVYFLHFIYSLFLFASHFSIQFIILYLFINLFIHLSTLIYKQLKKEHHKVTIGKYDVKCENALVPHFQFGNTQSNIGITCHMLVVMEVHINQPYCRSQQKLIILYNSILTFFFFFFFSAFTGSAFSASTSCRKEVNIPSIVKQV